MVSDSTGRPIPDAEVALPGLGLTTRTDASGAFTITGITAGNQQLIVRRVGYGALDTRLEFRPGESTDHRIVLTRLTVLDSVLTLATPDNDPLLRLFDEHRQRGFGSFLTRADLEKFEGSTLRTVMPQAAGVGIAYRSSHAYVMGRRGRISKCRLQPPDVPCIRREGRMYLPVSGEAGDAEIACYAQVYLDRTLMNRGTPTFPFDLNTIPVSQVEAIEWYPGGPDVPPEYSSMQADCGVMVVHTRRFRKK